VEASAQAQPNIALVKYWGKRRVTHNLPAAGSLSITLDGLWTRTRVRFEADRTRDEFNRNGVARNAELRRVSACLDLLRERAGVSAGAVVESDNNFPTAAGLASSASGFAALVVAAASALDLRIDPGELSAIARQGSGSAARSIFGGFVEMARGEDPEGHDARAWPLLPPQDWPLQVVIAVTSTGAKDVSSSDGMQRSTATSPFYGAWLETVPGDLGIARDAIESRDFDALATVSEHSCLKMHAVAMSAQPGLMYWSSATVDCLHAIRELRDAGVPVFFTIDAGPQVKAVCSSAATEHVRHTLAQVPGVEETLVCGLGAGARTIPDASSGAGD